MIKWLSILFTAYLLLFCYRGRITVERGCGYSRKEALRRPRKQAGFAGLLLLSFILLALGVQLGKWGLAMVAGAVLTLCVVLVLGLMKLRGWIS
ncbi:hypothetical protein GCM10011571_10630 [Marinithermofilum abyssi]|uniref:DUF3325 domain-containing protein n=1 Tax=Marinithermofilum abyssi TaxID=1571185 RepID=A0A8J2YC33_9BACL|nr:hypothetical protein [Marinithermofilum abyssi]GGE11187.1 hypothetical protein GCM10011571_10630 [Marinithermofilum abyssi]